MANLADALRAYMGSRGANPMAGSLIPQGGGGMRTGGQMGRQMIGPGAGGMRSAAPMGRQMIQPNMPQVAPGAIMANVDPMAMAAHAPPPVPSTPAPPVAAPMPPMSSPMPPVSGNTGIVPPSMRGIGDRPMARILRNSRMRRGMMPQ